jgi:hypothetical protein
MMFENTCLCYGKYEPVDVFLPLFSDIIIVQ